METAIRITLALVAAYLMGGISFALITGKLFYHVDLREHGSGNLGATNVVRVLGWRAGIAVAVLDMAKGAVAVQLALLLAPASLSPEGLDWVLIGSAIAAVLGHSYSPYIKMRGGKGVATAAGALAFITPLAFVIMLVAFFAVSAISRMVSLGSITVAAMYPILCVSFYRDRRAILIMSFVAAALVLWRHRSNMMRIVRGEESKIGRGGSALRQAAESLRDGPDREGRS